MFEGYIERMNNPDSIVKADWNLPARDN
jgi:hypothetical protein